MWRKRGKKCISIHNSRVCHCVRPFDLPFSSSFSSSVEVTAVSSVSVVLLESPWLSLLRWRVSVWVFWNGSFVEVFKGRFCLGDSLNLQNIYTGTPRTTRTNHTISKGIINCSYVIVPRSWRSVKRPDNPNNQARIRNGIQTHQISYFLTLTPLPITDPIWERFQHRQIQSNFPG